MPGIVDHKRSEGPQRYRVTVLYAIPEGQTNGKMDVEARNEIDAIRQVLEYMETHMRRHPVYEVHMVQVEPLRED